jgi:type I restriction enzyme S subunit
LSRQKEITAELDAIEKSIKLSNAQISLLDYQVKSLFNEMFGDPVFDTQNRGTNPLSDYIVNIKYGTSQPPKFNPKGKYKFIRATNIKNGRIVEKDMLRIDEIEAEKISKCKLKFGDFIMVRSGAFTGDTCVISNDYEGDYAGYDIIVTFDQTRMNPVFLNALVNTDYMTKVVKPMTGRAAQPHINSAQVSSLPILNVSKPEQDKFVNTIEQIDKLRFI